MHLPACEMRPKSSCEYTRFAQQIRCNLGHALPFSETSDAIENLSFSMMYLPRLRVTRGSKSLCRERGERSRHDCWLLASAVMGSSTEMKHHPFVVSADRLRGFDTLEWRTMLA